MPVLMVAALDILTGCWSGGGLSPGHQETENAIDITKVTMEAGQREPYISVRRL